MWLAESKLGSRPDAIRLLVDVGLFEDRPHQTTRRPTAAALRPKAGSVRLSAPPVPAVPTQPSPPTSGDTIDHFAIAKHTSAAGLRAYGARIDPLIGKLFRLPMYDPNGTQCSEITFPSSNSKGRYTAGKPTGLFLPGRLPKTGEHWIVCEGVKDAAALWQLGFLAAGLPGNTLPAKFVPMFESVDVVVMPDADRAGMRGAKKSADLLGKNTRIARLPCEISESKGRDVRDILQLFGERGPDAIRQVIAEARPAEEFNENGDRVDPPEPPPFVTELYTSLELLELSLDHRYLIDDTLVARQPCVIGGRSKSLKTSIATDLVISLGSGMPFLNRFNTERVNVAFFSGESGAATIRETAQRVANSKEVDLRQCLIYWGFNLPKLSQADHLDALAEIIVKKKLDVVVIDPLYLSLLSAETASMAGNLFSMGAALLPLSELAQETGVTPILLHHFRKSSMVDDFEPCGLEELSQAGIAEWARQWLLLERRSPYQMDGHHELYMRTGGSAGHAGLWGIDVNEGTLETGRRWSVSLRSIEDIRAENRRAREQRKNEEQEAREREQCQKLLNVLKDYPNGETVNQLREKTGMGHAVLHRTLQIFLDNGGIEKCKVEKKKISRDGYRLSQEWMEDF